MLKLFLTKLKTIRKQTYISIEEKSVKCEEIEFSFDLDDFSQNRILKGLDKIDITLEYISDIENFSKSRKDWKPKLT